MHNRGLVLRTQGKLPESVNEYRAALKILRGFDVPGQLCRTLSNLGEVERLSGNAAEATAALEAALKLAEKIGDKLVEGVARTNLAMIALEAARYDDALAAFRAAAEVFQKLGYQEGVLG